MNRYIFILLLVLFMTACNAESPTVGGTEEIQTLESSPTMTSHSTGTSSPQPTSTHEPTITPTLAADAWMSMPVIPDAVSGRMIEVYQLGQELGRNPHAFSRLMDCDGQPYSFLGDFDEGSQAYILGEYAYLQDVIDYFQGSYGYLGVATDNGFNSASALSPQSNDPQQCEAMETPLACEIRLHNPSFILIALGTNDFGQPERFERNLRHILDYLLSNGIVPILGTKGDNLEGDHEINSIIARLAYEYEAPLWNYWAAIQPLPNQGIRTDDNYHPTHPGFEDGMPNDFSSSWKMDYGFPWRNLTALQILDLLMRSVVE